MEVPQLRLRTETGMGETLWADNEAARARWLSYVDPADLPISDELRGALDELARLTSLGWQRRVPGQEDAVVEPPEPDDWREPTAEEVARARELRALVRTRLADELGAAVRVVVEDA